MKNRRPTTVIHRYLSVLPSVVLALLPRLACPCQFPAYAGLLSSMGLSFLTQTVYLFPLTAAFGFLRNVTDCLGRQIVWGG